MKNNKNRNRSINILSQVINKELQKELNNIKQYLPKIDKIHAEIKKILNNRRISNLSDSEKLKLHNQLIKLKNTLNKAFTKLNGRIEEIYIIDSFQPNAFTYSEKFEAITGIFISDKDNRIYIYYFDQIINILEPKELTAVLLHEIGHTYYWLWSYLSQTISSIFFLASFGTLTAGLILFSNSLIFISTLLALASLLRYPYYHIAEYYADKFTTDLGYGEYQTSALIKLEKYYEHIHSVIYTSTTSKGTDIKTILKNKNLPPEKNKSLLSILLNFLTTLFSSRPNTKDRICKIYQHIYELIKNDDKVKNNPELLNKIKEQIIKKLKSYNINNCKIS